MPLAVLVQQQRDEPIRAEILKHQNDRVPGAAGLILHNPWEELTHSPGTSPLCHHGAGVSLLQPTEVTKPPRLRAQGAAQGLCPVP